MRRFLSCAIRHAARRQYISESGPAWSGLRAWLRFPAWLGLTKPQRTPSWSLRGLSGLRAPRTQQGQTVELEPWVKESVQQLSSEYGVAHDELSGVLQKRLEWKQHPAYGTAGHVSDVVKDLKDRIPTLMRLGASPADIIKGLSVSGYHMSRGTWAWRPTADMEAIEAACRRDGLDATLRRHTKEVLASGAKSTVGEERVQKALQMAKVMRSRSVEPEAQSIIGALAEDTGMDRTHLSRALSSAVTISSHPRFGLDGHQVEVARDIVTRARRLLSLGIDAATIAEGLDKSGPIIAVGSWAWRPLHELEEIPSMWEQAGFSDVLKAEPVKILSIASRNPNPKAPARMTTALHAVMALEEAGFSKEEIVKIIRRYPQVLQRGAALGRHFLHIQDALGCEVGEARKVVLKSPDILDAKREQIDTARKVFHDIGMTGEESRKFLFQRPRAAKLLNSSLMLKLIQLIEMGMTKAEIREMAAKNAAAIAGDVPGEDFNIKIALLREMGMPLGEVAQWSGVLRSSVSYFGPRALLLGEAREGRLPSFEERIQSKSRGSALMGANSNCRTEDAVVKHSGISIEGWKLVKRRWEDEVLPALQRQFRERRVYRWPGKKDPGYEEKVREKWAMLMRLGDHDRIEVDAETGEWRVASRVASMTQK